MPTWLVAERAYIMHLAHVDTTLRLLVNDMAAYGVFTPAGAPRRTHDAFLKAIDRFDRLAQRIGIERRGRSVHSLSEYLRSAVQSNEGAS